MSATPAPSGDYVLGTHEIELERLGFQHQIWRPMAVDAWRAAGVGERSRVLDVGCGPGYATADLADLVGATGRVVGLERSPGFLRAAEERCAERGLEQVSLHACDLMVDEVPGAGFDVAWVRWVASFVTSPAELVRKIAEALKPGGRVIFQEYADYASWRIAPGAASHPEFVQHVMRSWRDEGGEPDVALQLPALMAEQGLRIVASRPHVFCVPASDPIWRWPAGFMDSNLDRLLGLGKVDKAWVDRARAEMRAAAEDPQARMLTPLVLELIAEKD